MTPIFLSLSLLLTLSFCFPLAVRVQLPYMANTWLPCRRRRRRSLAPVAPATVAVAAPASVSTAAAQLIHHGPSEASTPNA